MAAATFTNDVHIANHQKNDQKKMRLSCKSFFHQLIQRKKVESLEIEHQTVNELRPNALSLVHLTAIGLGGTIGSGIFILGGQAAGRFAGPSVILSFILSGILALFSAMSFSEMSSIMATPGSAYTYTYVALGEYAAFFIGWTYILFYQLAASSVAVAWSQYLVDLIDIISAYNSTRSIVQAPVAWSEALDTFYATGQVINLPAIAITIAITIVLILGIRETSNINLALVIFKIIVLLIFIFAGCVYVDRKNYTPFFPPNQGSFKYFGITGMLEGVSYVFFACLGFESVSTLTEEAKRPSKNIPLATILSVVITILLYVGVATVMVGLVPYTKLDNNDPLSVAIETTPYGLWLLIVVNLGAVASLATVTANVLLSQTRIFYAMANDGLLPAAFARIHKTRKTPWVGTLICGIICSILSGVCPVDIIGEAASIAALIIFIFVHICVVFLRFTYKNLNRGFSVPFGRWLIPVVGTILCILLLATMSSGTAIRFAVWTGIGQIFYFSYSFRYSKIRKQRVLSSDSIFELVPPPNIYGMDPTSVSTPAPSVSGPDEKVSSTVSPTPTSEINLSIINDEQPVPSSETVEDNSSVSNHIYDEL